MKVWLCADDATYAGGSLLRASWRIRGVPLDALHSLEVSVLWHTEGKGDEDLHVHHFQRLSEAQIRRVGIES